MFLIKKSNKSNGRLYRATSRFFSFKKLKLFTYFLKKNAGRNNTGQITVRHKKKLKKNLGISVNYSRNNIKKNVVIIESCFWKKKKPFLILVKNRYNSLSYFVAPHGIFLKKIIKTVFFNFRIHLLKKIGNLFRLGLLKQSNCIFNLLSAQYKLYKICLAGGTYFKILYKSFCGNFFVLKIPSGKQIKVLLNCFAVLGKNSNKNIKKEMVGLAGISFFRGKRPSVRGVAMNPVDHPNGGRTKTNKPEKSPWGWVAKKKK